MTLLYPSFLWLFIPLLLLLWQRPRKLISSVHLIILMLLAVTLCRPVQEQALQESAIEAKDIIIALDVSYSMTANDISPTRYEFAKETISALLKNNPSDNVMLMVFTTNPLLLSPPTTDHTLIRVALESLKPEYILTKGTSLEKLFRKIASLKSGHKNLILITDGGEENKLEILTSLLQKADVSLTVLALGSIQGTILKNADELLLKDKEGNLVISRINPILEALASSVLGTYILAQNTPEITAAKLQSSLKNDKNTIQKKQHRYKELYQIPLTLAILLFLMVHTRAVKYLLILFTFFGLQAEASVFDNYHLHLAYRSYHANDFNTTKRELKQIKVPSLQSQMALADTYYRLGAFKKAIETYKSIRSTSWEIKQQLYYNIANAYAMLKSYDKAKIYYAKTLQLGEDEDARHNLHIVALLSKRRDAPLGIAHPKSQDSSRSKSENQGEKDETRSEDQPSSGSGGAGKNSSDESASKKEQEKNKLLNDESAEPYPLSSKVYELINKGYIREKQPW